MQITIHAENAGRRLDKYLFNFLNNAPHSFIFKMLRKKRIKLNANRALGSEMLSEGDVLRFYLSEETIKSFRKDIFVPAAKPMPDIVYEDVNLLAVNKPAGLPSQGGMDSKGDSLLARLLFYLQEKGDYPPDADFAPGICNRLDVNTSGIVVCGKNLKTLQELNAMFRERKIKKEYLAVVEGIPGHVNENKMISAFFQKEFHARTAKITKEPSCGTAEIITYYTVIATNSTHSLLLVEPLTGRFHQIRAHLAFIGHPLAGDNKYGGKPIKYARNQLLHCLRISTDYMTDMSFEAPLPDNFNRCLKDWFKYKIHGCQ